MRSAVHKGPNSLNIYPEGGGGDIGGETGGGGGGEGGGGFSKALQALVLISRALTLPMLGRGGSGVVVGWWCSEHGWVMPQ